MLRCAALCCAAGGPVIMLQPENEYGNIEQYYGSDGKKYAQWAADLVKGMDPTGLPIAMCQQQGAKNAFLGAVSM